MMIIELNITALRSTIQNHFHYPGHQPLWSSSTVSKYHVYQSPYTSSTASPSRSVLDHHHVTFHTLHQCSSSSSPPPTNPPPPPPPKVSTSPLPSFLPSFLPSLSSLPLSLLLSLSLSLSLWVKFIKTAFPETYPKEPTLQTTHCAKNSAEELHLRHGGTNPLAPTLLESRRRRRSTLIQSVYDLKSLANSAGIIPCLASRFHCIAAPSLNGTSANGTAGTAPTAALRDLELPKRKICRNPYLPHPCQRLLAAAEVGKPMRRRGSGSRANCLAPYPRAAHGFRPKQRNKGPRWKVKAFASEWREFFEVDLGDKVKRRLRAIFKLDPRPLQIRREIRPTAKLRKPSFWSIARRPNPL